MISGMDPISHRASASNLVRFLPGRALQKHVDISDAYRRTNQPDREYLTNLLRNSISPAPGVSPRLGAFSTPGGGSKKQGKTPPYGREPAMRLSTKGRYAVMAMADLAGMPPSRTMRAPAGGPGRYRRPPGHFAVLSGTAVRQAAPRRAGHQRARARRRLSPVAAQPANCASPTSSWRWTSPSPPPAARPAAPRAAPRPARAASPTICGKSWASRSMSSCRRSRWPMWWSGGCWAAPSPATIMGSQSRTSSPPSNAMHYLRSQRHFAAAPGMPVGDDPCPGDRRQSVFGPCQGRAARAVMEEAREEVAALAGAKPSRGDLHQRRHRSQPSGAVRRRGRLAGGRRGRASPASFVSAIEHQSVLATRRPAGGAFSLGCGWIICR